jgi:multidrug efflux system membrane fusion protein
MHKQKKYQIILAIVIVLIGIFTYTHTSGNFFSSKNKQQSVTVTAQQVIQKDVTIFIATIGTVEAYSTVNVKSQVDGQILKVGFTEGQIVQQGQLLFTIDPRPYQIALQQAQANLAKDQAQLTTAQLTLKRYAKLIKPGYVSQQDYDTYKANADALVATVKADQAAIANAQLQLSYTNITAPISGRAGDVLVEAGNLVKSTDGTVLVTINQINPINVTFTVPQQYLTSIQNQQAKAPLVVTAHLGKHQTEQGQLTFINNAIDTTTGTIQLKATFVNTDQLLWPGQFVKLNLASASVKNALIVPNSAVQTGQKGTYVYIIRNGKAFYQSIKTGATVKEGTIIESGLKADDQVVVDGQFLLTDGTPVKAVFKS